MVAYFFSYAILVRYKKLRFALYGRGVDNCMGLTMKKRFSISAVLMLSNIIGLTVYAAALSIIVYSRIKTDFSDYFNKSLKSSVSIVYEEIDIFKKTCKDSTLYTLKTLEDIYSIF